MKFDYAALSWVLFACLFTTLVGCGENAVDAGFKKANAVNIQRVANAYRMFASLNGNVGPENVSELKEFIKSDERIPPRLGLTSSDMPNLDEYFISSADGEPFAILFSQKISPDFDYSALVFDKTGVDGVRRIALACSVVIDVIDDKQYDRIFEGKIKKSDVPAHVFGGGSAIIDESTESGVE